MGVNPRYSMSSNESNLEVAAVLGFCAGLYWFFKGFRVYREYRVLADTPEIPIRSIPMGLVEIHGKAKTADGKLVNSPVSQTPCLFYKVDIEKWQTNSKGGGSWQKYKTDADGVPFYLEDMTGRVLVDAHGAEYDLIQCCRRETGGITGSLGRLFGKADPTLSTGTGVSDTSLVTYLESLGPAKGGGSLAESLGQLALGSGLSLGRSSSHRYRLTESCVLPEHWYDVTGTCVENPEPKDEHDRNMIVKGENEPTFLISWRSEAEIERTLRNRAAKYIFGGAALSIVCLAVILGKLGMF